MSEYIFVHLIDKQPVGSDLGQHIPLHMTLLHWFTSEHSPDAIVYDTDAVLESFAPITVRTTHEDLFGPDKDVPVMRTERTAQLLNLHLGLLATMKSIGATFDERWVGTANWNPHVTHKKDARLAPNETLNVTDVDLISKLDKNGSRTILHRFDLETS